MSKRELGRIFYSEAPCFNYEKFSIITFAEIIAGTLDCGVMRYKAIGHEDFLKGRLPGARSLAPTHNLGRELNVTGTITIIIGNTSK